MRVAKFRNENIVKNIDFFLSSSVTFCIHIFVRVSSSKNKNIFSSEKGEGDVSCERKNATIAFL